MNPKRFSGLVVPLVAILGFAACGDPDPGPVTAGASTTQPSAGDEQGYDELEPPSVAVPPSAAQALRDAVTFVACTAADDHVSGALVGAEALVGPDTESICYIEQVGDESLHYAGVLIVPVGTDAGQSSIVDLVQQGATVVTATAGLVEVETFAGRDVRAPGGGYAEFGTSSGTRGRVVRLHENRSQAMFSIALLDESQARIEITSNRTPGIVVRMAREFIRASGTERSPG